ncbi:hypothetical protein ACFSZS_10555 [Seohaeicola zhoushanensis]
MQTKMLIGGGFEAGTETEENVLNPRTGESILLMPEASPVQIDKAVAARAPLPPGPAPRRANARPTCCRLPTPSRPMPMPSPRSRR